MTISRYNAPTPTSANGKKLTLQDTIKAMSADDPNAPATKPVTTPVAAPGTSAGVTIQQALASGPAQAATKPLQTATQATAAAPPATPATTFGNLAGSSDINPSDPYNTVGMDLAHQQATERLAAQTDLQIANARSLQSAQARANLGGQGTSGAAAAEQNDLSNANARNAVETMATLRQKQDDESFQAQQRKAAIWDTEISSGEDLDGDHSVGPPGSATGQTPEQAKQSQQADKKDRLEDELTATNKGYDLWQLDADNPPGSIEKPYTVPSARQPEMLADGFKLTAVPASGIPKNKGESDHVTLYVDQDGHYYLFT